MLLLVLRMLSAFVGEETFLRGVSIYLKRHLYGNSVSKDLWDGISEAAGKIRVFAILNEISLVCITRNGCYHNDEYLGV